MSTLLAEHYRRAAHGRHLCGWCGNNIAAGELYNDQRIADNGTVFTWREHRDCARRLWNAMSLAGLYGDDLEGHDPREFFDELMAEYPEVSP